MTQHTLQVADVDLPDWRWILSALRTHFRTDGFTAGALFVADVARIADELNHHPDVALRYGEVIFTLLGGIWILGDSVPSPMGLAGIGLIVGGMILGSILTPRAG